MRARVPYNYTAVEYENFKIEIGKMFESLLSTVGVKIDPSQQKFKIHVARTAEQLWSFSKNNTDKAGFYSGVVAISAVEGEMYIPGGLDEAKGSPLWKIVYPSGGFVPNFVLPVAFGVEFYNWIMNFLRPGPGLAALQTNDNSKRKLIAATILAGFFGLISAFEIAIVQAKEGFTPGNLALSIIILLGNAIMHTKAFMGLIDYSSYILRPAGKFILNSFRSCSDTPEMLERKQKNALISANESEFLITARKQLENGIWRIGDFLLRNGDLTNTTFEAFQNNHQNEYPFVTKEDFDCLKKTFTRNHTGNYLKPVVDFLKQYGDISGADWTFDNIDEKINEIINARKKACGSSCCGCSCCKSKPFSLEEKFPHVTRANFQELQDTFKKFLKSDYMKSFSDFLKPYGDISKWNFDEIESKVDKARAKTCRSFWYKNRPFSLTTEFPFVTRENFEALKESLGNNEEIINPKSFEEAMAYYRMVINFSSDRQMRKDPGAARLVGTASAIVGNISTLGYYSLVILLFTKYLGDAAGYSIAITSSMAFFYLVALVGLDSAEKLFIKLIYDPIRISLEQLHSWGYETRASSVSSFKELLPTEMRIHGVTSAAFAVPLVATAIMSYPTSTESTTKYLPKLMVKWFGGVEADYPWTNAHPWTFMFLLTAGGAATFNGNPMLGVALGASAFFMNQLHGIFESIDTNKITTTQIISEANGQVSSLFQIDTKHTINALLEACDAKKVAHADVEEAGLPPLAEAPREKNHPFVKLAKSFDPEKESRKYGFCTWQGFRNRFVSFFAGAKAGGEDYDKILHPENYKNKHEELHLLVNAYDEDHDDYFYDFGK